MTLHIELTAQTEEWLNAEAQRRGVPPRDFARRVLEEQATMSRPLSKIDPLNAAAIAWLDTRLADEATTDPEEIRKAEDELDELKRNMNANRAATGERQVFP